MTSDCVPTVGELRQAYVEASGATVAQEFYYAEQVAEFERGIARIRADALLEFVESAQDLLHCSGDTRWKSRALDRADRIEKEAGL